MELPVPARFSFGVYRITGNTCVLAVFKFGGLVLSGPNNNINLAVLPPTVQIICAHT